MIVIIGAGPTGLGAAYRLHELGVTDYLVLERAAGPGGLASSYVDEHGFTWDVGGHVQFSHYRYYDEALDRAVTCGWLEHDRNASVWIRGGWVPYPFQYNIHRLPDAIRDQALKDLEALAPPYGRPANFREWIEQGFGHTLATIFMVPYNLKVWGYPLETLGVEWMGERVAPIDLDRLRRNVASGKDDVSWGPNNRFRFPLEGGTGAIWTHVAALLPPERMRWHSEVTAVDLARRVVSAVQAAARFAQGVRQKFGEALAFIAGVPGKVLAALGNLGSLLYNSGIQLVQGLIGGIRADNVARLGANGWEKLGDGLNDMVRALHVSQAGVLYADGDFGGSNNT